MDEFSHAASSNQVQRVCSLKKNKIRYNMKGNFVVTKDYNWTSNTNAKVLKKIYTNYLVSQLACANVLYFALDEDLETMFCFMNFQEIKVESRKKQKPITNLRVSGMLPSPKKNC